ncbi:hypothetical protein Gotur_002755 [Gossypium turneri]
MGWLQDIFPEPGNDSIEIERIRYDRTYIIEIIGGYLMSELSRNLIHLRWLLKLIDFRAASELSWGSTVLATLYREMCGVTPPNNAKIEEYIEIWENRYDHIPTREPIIVPELAKRRGPLNQRRRGDGTSPSTAPKQLLGPLPQATTPTP